MGQWILWDDENNTLLSVVRHLPPALQGRDSGYLALLGYRERVTVQPENFIPRFSSLVGSSKFEKMPDGRVLETFPDADFSVERIRLELKRQVREDASRELGRTDWYVVRKVELGTEIPGEVSALRKKIRDHVDWVSDDIDKTEPRALVEYQWKFPTRSDQTMVNGVPVVFNPSPPQPPPLSPTSGDSTGRPITGEAQGVFGNADPTLVDPAPEPPDEPEFTVPDTTDGPVPVYLPGEERPHLDPNGVPLVTVYAPNVEDAGPRPDNNQEQ